MDVIKFLKDPNVETVNHPTPAQVKKARAMLEGVEDYTIVEIGKSLYAMRTFSVSFVTLSGVSSIEIMRRKS